MAVGNVEWMQLPGLVGTYLELQPPRCISRQLSEQNYHRQPRLLGPVQ